MTTAPATTIMWLALPAGIATAAPAAAAVSAFVSPRLSGPDGAALADFPVLAGWAATVAGGSFALTVDDGSASGATVTATVVSPPPDPQLWAELFPPTTPVVPRTFDESNVQTRTPSTYSQQAVHDLYQSGYASMHASSPVAVPPHQTTQQLMPAFMATAPPRALLHPEAGREDEVTALRQAATQVAGDLVAHAAAGTLPGAIAHAHAIATRLAELSPPGTFVPLVADTGTDQGAVGQLLAFHHVPPEQVGVSPGPVTDPVAPDFHAILTSLLAYPLLLRKLGLVVDLQVPLTALPSARIGAEQPGRLRIVPPPLGAATVLTPWTAYTRDGDEIFTAAPASPASPETVAGLVNLALPQAYDLFQLDVDGAALKASNAVNAPGTDPNAPSPLPFLRTTGLTLSRSQQAAALFARMAANGANDNALGSGSSDAVTLYAEDVLHGMRIDVHDSSTGAWASLHRRVGTYTVAGQPVLTGAADEGAAQPSASHLPDVGTQQSPLRVPEALARWEGWSLSVPRPGAAMTSAGPARVTPAPAAGGVPLTASFAVEPSSLPRLRYGRSYQMRARAVDVAGNSLSPDQADDLLHTLATLGDPVPVLPPGGTGQVFQRFEPVTGPVLVARERFTEGESIERLVVRSDRAEAAASCGQRLSGLADAGGLRYLAVSERHLVPPKAALTEAERSGVLDALTAEAAYALAHKEPGQLTDTFVVDAATGSPVALDPVPDTDPVTGAAAGARPAVELVASGTSAYAVHHEAALTVPYLPDPMSVGVVLCGLPGQPAGTQGTVGPDGALAFAPWSLDESVPGQIGGSTTAVGFGGTWPLLAPVRLSVAEGDGPPSWDATARALTVALPKGRSATVRISSSLPSGALDVLGIWSWVLTDRAAKGQPPPSASDAELALRGLAWLLTPYRELTLVHAVQRPLTDPGLSNPAVARQPGDTTASLSIDIAVDAPSTARIDLSATWSEPVDDPAAAGPGTENGHAAVAASTVPPAPGAGQLTGSVLHLAARHQFGDTRHRTVTYQATAASAFREYFPPSVADGDMTAAGTPVTVEVPSSARPSAPVIRAAVPLFSWQRPVGLDGARVRTQTGIRFLLERPWFASGDGEQLAVILAPAGSRPPADNLRPYVTYWGSDPIWGGAPADQPPAAGTFGGPGTPPVLTLPEAGPVQIVPQPVTYRSSPDPSQQLWVCDVPVAVPASDYQPFVRLAVARYQPHSLPGFELSPVVLAPPVQILPQRTVTVSATASPDVVNVQVEGTTYHAGALPDPPDPAADFDGFMVNGIEQPPNLVQVTLQQRIPGTTDDAGWRPTLIQGKADVFVSGIPAGGAGPGTLLWEGTVTLPSGRSPGQYRILVTESQLLLSDAFRHYTWQERNDPVLHPPTHPAPPVINHSDYYRPGSGRLVFAETIPV
jgi:hypothetical protein